MAQATLSTYRSAKRSSSKFSGSVMIAVASVLEDAALQLRPRPLRMELTLTRKSSIDSRRNGKHVN